MQSATLLEVHTVQQLISQGKSVKEIASTLQTTLNRTKEFIRENNLTGSLTNKSYWTWDDQEDAQLSQECLNGLTLEEIATAHLRTTAAIRIRMKNLGLSLTSSESGEVTTLQEKRRWTSEEIAVITELHKAGHSTADIAHSINRSEKAVAIKLKKIDKPPKSEAVASFTCSCGKDRIRTVFQCGHGTCQLCSRKFRTCPTCEVKIQLRVELAF